MGTSTMFKLFVLLCAIVALTSGFKLKSRSMYLAQLSYYDNENCNGDFVGSRTYLDGMSFVPADSDSCAREMICYAEPESTECARIRNESLLREHGQDYHSGGRLWEYYTNQKEGVYYQLPGQEDLLEEWEVCYKSSFFAHCYYKSTRL